MACLLFNLALHKVIKDSGINTRGTIFNKSVQIFAFADDIDIIAQTPNALKEAFASLETEANKMNLKINQEKTKYMPCTKTEFRESYFEIGPYKFETTSNFKYLGSEISNLSSITPEIRNRITAANRCFFGLKKYLKSNFIRRETKLLIYKTLIRPILIYSAETWVLTEKDKQTLAVFERKVLRSIFKGIKEGNFWRKRTNLEIYRCFKEPDVIKTIAIQRIKWAGHVIRMDDSSTTKKIFLAKPITTRVRGRPKLRWIDCIEKDFEILKVNNWKSTAKNRAAWGKLLRKARAHPGLSCQ